MGKMVAGVLIFLAGAGKALLDMAHTGLNLTLRYTDVAAKWGGGQAVALTVTVVAENPTSNSLTITAPVVRVILNGAQIGQTPPSDQKITLDSRAATSFKTSVNLDYLPLAQAMGGEILDLATGDKPQLPPVVVETLITANGVALPTFRQTITPSF